MKRIVVLLVASLFLGNINTAFPQRAEYVQFEKAKNYFKKGIIFFNNMKYLAAVEYFRKAVSAYPDYYTARDYLSRSYRLAGFTESALRELENLHELQPDNVRILDRINRLRYSSINDNKSNQEPDLVHHATYLSRQFKRFSFTSPTDICTDSEKNVYVTSFKSGKLVKINANGEGVFTITPSYEGRLYGVACRKKRVAVTDFSGDSVYVLNTSGKILNEFGESGSSDGKFHGPQGLVFDNKGFIYVVDSGNNRIQKFDDTGKFILTFGSKGSYGGQFKNPTDIAFSQNKLYITDTGNKRIVVFDQYGNFIKNLILKGSNSPRGIDSTKNSLLISDEKSGLCIYNINENSIRWFKTWNRKKKAFCKIDLIIIG